ncbi:hypothetical protein [Planctomicrobium sp. SH664]|uniref:hypothetical protein n=1 Tax=Planctomicrobium sp. SH664 TaxID=3448125 RepID=UPI003F5BF1FC
MDFRTCPACQASVLEDDVQECPFCGASMSGKPQPKKPAPQKASGPAPSKPAAADAAPKPAAPATPAARRPSGPAIRPPDENAEDPFEVDTSAVRRAIKLSPKPTKTRTYEVVCRMCETPGYIQPSDAGKDVHCCNPDCIVPVFKAPRPQVTEEIKAPEKNLKPLYIGGGLAALLAIGGGVWYAMQPPPVVDRTDDVVAVHKDEERLKGLIAKDNAAVTKVERLLDSPEAVRTEAVARIKDRVRDRNISRARAHQIAAEIYASAGQLDEANGQFQDLRRVRDGAAPFFQIQPLVETAWLQRRTGKTEEANQSLTEALARAKDLPKSVRRTQDAVASLAAALVALGRQEEALQLIQVEQDTDARGRASTLWKGTTESKTFNFDAMARSPWHVVMPEPLRMSVVETLVGRGEVETALAFAATGNDASSQAACRAAWAGQLPSLQKGQAVSTLNAALASAKFSPAEQTRLWAALAAGYLEMGDKVSAQSALDRALTLLDGLQVPGPMPLPTKRQILDGRGRPFGGLADPTANQTASLAAADVALVQNRLGQRDAAKANLAKALDFAQATTPSPVATQAAVDECQQSGQLVRRELASQLGVKGDDSKFEASFNNYRRQCNVLDQLADTRLATQAEILRAAAMEGMLPEVWGLVRDRLQNGNARVAEPYFETTLPGMLIAAASVEGQSTLVSEIKAAAGSRQFETDPIDQLEVRTSALIAAGKLAEAADVLKAAYLKDLAKKQPDRVDRVGLRMSSRVQSRQSPAEALKFIKSLHDANLKEEALLLLGGYAIQHGKGPELWRLTADDRDLNGMEALSLYRGLVFGAEPENTASATAAATPVN